MPVPKVFTVKISPSPRFEDTRIRSQADPPTWSELCEQKRARERDLERRCAELATDALTDALLGLSRFFRSFYMAETFARLEGKHGS